MNNGKSSGVWDSKECALILIDYQPGIMTFIQSSDPKAVELNAWMAASFGTSTSLRG